MVFERIENVGVPDCAILAWVARALSLARGIGNASWDWYHLNPKQGIEIEAFIRTEACSIVGVVY